ncbi:citrate synthase [Steroidobacter agaridevorans]|uniref:Citrate synthase n=1 Tax=Steroidobacter agaridevorans TaxID=2695856 RepID=A0A829Y552_9GAMM|nr:citrate/2-methylcitrate synthase [Steroidobacter agaridevorans]GFE78223.1 citrate synthase [Steroidobacter agaridevorans]GFE91280.1 citrate synthase [Steroidobacter agaridevorans]
MSESLQHVHKGLEGVIADTTSVSLIDGDAGRLYYRGYAVEELARKRFAEVMHLVVFGTLPDADRLQEVEDYLWIAGRLPPELAASLRQIARHGEHPMATLQAITTLLALEPPAVSLGRSPQEEEALIVAARIPAAIATIYAALQDHPEHPYPASRRYGERYLQLLHGRQPSPIEVSVFESAQILQLDHGFNASTFTARVVTSTLAPATSALSAAMGALYGPLHGAADQQALEMALEVGQPERAREFVAQCLASGRKVMGMGHREYRVVDPRSRMIRALAQQVAHRPEHIQLLDVLSAVDEAFIEQTREKRRTLRANLEFYKGVVYLALGIPKEFFTASFAAARVFGWIAHVMEQRQDNRIIRPTAHYVGPAPRSMTQ